MRRGNGEAPPDLSSAIEPERGKRRRALYVIRAASPLRFQGDEGQATLPAEGVHTFGRSKRSVLCTCAGRNGDASGGVSPGFGRTQTDRPGSASAAHRRPEIDRPVDPSPRAVKGARALVPSPAWSPGRRGVGGLLIAWLWRPVFRDGSWPKTRASPHKNFLQSPQERQQNDQGIHQPHVPPAPPRCRLTRSLGCLQRDTYAPSPPRDWCVFHQPHKSNRSGTVNSGQNVYAV